MTKNLTTGLISTFYEQFLNEEIEQIIDTSFNRSQKRRIEKIKNFREKINAIIDNDSNHRVISSNLYTIYSEKIEPFEDFDLDDIADIICFDNLVPCLIYCINNFYFDRKNRSNFADFLIASDIMFLIIKKDEPELENLDFKITEINDTDETLENYLCIIKLENDDFFNIYPKYVLNNNCYEPCILNYFPERGNINVYCRYDFSKKNFHDPNNNVWILKLDYKQDLEENINGKTGELGVTNFKINGQKLIEQNRISSLKENSIYEIFTILATDNLYEIKIDCVPISELVLVQKNNFLYGPYSYYYLDNNHLLKPSSSDFLVNKYFTKKESIIELVLSNRNIRRLTYLNENEFLIEKIDTIDDDFLIASFINFLNKKYDKNTKLTINEINNVVKNAKKFPSNLNNERLTKLRNIFTDLVAKEDMITNVAEILATLIKQENNEIILNALTSKILTDDELAIKLYGVQSIKARLEQIIDNINNTKLDLSYLSKDNQEIFDTINLLDNEKDILSLLSDIKNMNTLYQKLNNELETIKTQIIEKENYSNYLQEKITLRNEQLDIIANNVENKLNNAINNAADVVFDGMIASKLLSKASKWDKQSNNNYYENEVMKLNDLTFDTFKNHQEIKDYINNTIKLYRTSYTNNEITNIIICLIQGFLTVFAGEPGVGKTSICNIINKVIGYDSRYVEISVERGWTSRRDLIGYYNPLTKEFNKSNSALFSAFNILHIENKKDLSLLPYFILLDEANLSPMEHYWADFMNVCDFDKENRSINVGEDYIYNIPDTLRFMATINYDHTTETLSPRLIDRSWIIVLNPKSDDSYIDTKAVSFDKKNISFKDLKAVYSSESYSEKLDQKVVRAIDDIYTMFNNQAIAISPRIKKMINDYLIVGVNLFETTTVADQNFVALDFVVAQKLLPKIDGFGDDFQHFLITLKDYCSTNQMTTSKNILEKIIANGEKNMQYYHFFN